MYIPSLCLCNDSDIKSSDSDSEKDTENDQLDQVATQEAANYSYNKRLETKVNDQRHYERV